MSALQFDSDKKIINRKLKKSGTMEEIFGLRNNDISFSQQDYFKCSLIERVFFNIIKARSFRIISFVSIGIILGFFFGIVSGLYLEIYMGFLGIFYFFPRIATHCVNSHIRTDTWDRYESEAY